MGPDPSSGAQGKRGREVPLSAVLGTAIEAGVRVQMSGGATARVGATMERIAAALGAVHVEPSVSSVVVGLTIERDGQTATAFRRTPHIGTNFAELSALSEFSHGVQDMDPAEVSTELADIESEARRYPTPVVLSMLGVACGAFAALFGADVGGILLAGLGGGLGAWVRHLCIGRQFVPFISCGAAAFVSTAIVLLLHRLTGPTSNLEAALAACVLYLVPGVPLLNGATDLLSTHHLNGLVRLTSATMIVLGSGLGVALALGLGAWL